MGPICFLLVFILVIFFKFKIIIFKHILSQILSWKIELENVRSLLNKISFYSRSKVPHFQSNFAIKMILNIIFFPWGRRLNGCRLGWKKKKTREKHEKKTFYLLFNFLSRELSQLLYKHSNKFCRVNRVNVFSILSGQAGGAKLTVNYQV